MSFTGPRVLNEKQKLKLEGRKGPKGANALAKNSGFKKKDKEVDKASWKERRLVRKEWDAWVSNFGIRMIWGDDKIQNMTWFGGLICSRLWHWKWWNHETKMLGCEWVICVDIRRWQECFTYKDRWWDTDYMMMGYKHISSDPYKYKTL